MAQSRSNQLPYALEAAVVEVAGKAFWYKRPLLDLMQRAGVPRELLRQCGDLSKYAIAREVWGELHERGEAGVTVQRQIIRNMAELATFGDEVDVDAAKAAVKGLKVLAEQNGVLAPKSSAVAREVKRREVKERRAAHESEVRSRREYDEKLEVLRRRFFDLVRDASDPQARGFSLEPLLGELIELEELPYTKPYRKGTVTQTDGFFSFDGFHYLIEARWRKAAPDVAALNAFEGKVASTLQSTRGLFLSMAGFRDDAVTEFAHGRRNVILMSGAELTIILEGRLKFEQAMRSKVEEAARTGTLFTDLA